MAESAEDYVWLGDLSGYEVQPDGPGAEATLYLRHRCGWTRELHPADCYVGNIVTITREHPARCLPPRPPAPGSLRDRLMKLGAAGS